jgi:hypothetical protein
MLGVKPLRQVSNLNLAVWRRSHRVGAHLGRLDSWTMYRDHTVVGRGDAAKTRLKGVLGLWDLIYYEIIRISPIAAVPRWLPWQPSKRRDRMPARQDRPAEG